MSHALPCAIVTSFICPENYLLFPLNNCTIHYGESWNRWSPLLKWNKIIQNSSVMDTWPLPCTYWSRLRPPNSRQTKQTGVKRVILVPIWLRLTDWPQSQILASGASKSHLNWSEMDTWPLPSTHWSRLRSPNSCQTKQTGVEWVKLVPIWLRLTDWPQSQSLASGASKSHLNWSKMDTWPLPSPHWSRLRSSNSRQTKQTGVEWVILVPIQLRLTHWPQSQSLASVASMSHLNCSKMDT